MSSFASDSLTCDRGSIGEWTSPPCLRLVASRLGLGSLLRDEVAFDTVLCNRPGDGWLDEGVEGLPAGMVLTFGRARVLRRALHDLLVGWTNKYPTWSRSEGEEIG